MKRSGAATTRGAMAAAAVALVALVLALGAAVASGFTLRPRGRATASVARTSAAASGSSGSTASSPLPPSGHLPFLAPAAPAPESFGGGCADGHGCGCGGGCAEGAAAGGWMPSLSLTPSAVAAVLALARGGASGRAAKISPEAEHKTWQQRQGGMHGLQHEELRGPVHVVAVVKGAGARAPKLDATWVEIMEHMHRRMQFVDPDFTLHVVTEEEVLSPGGAAALQGQLGPTGAAKPDAVYFLGIEHPEVAARVAPSLHGVANVVALDCCDALTQHTRIGPARPKGRFAAVWRALPLPTRRKKLLNLFGTVESFWERGHSDDLLYMVLVVINATVRNIPSVSEILKPVTLQALRCMISNCGKQIVDCQKNPTCKAALRCLENCAPNDQVCRYRCIVQYETEAFSQFALCILQKHNCLRNHAAIPTLPDPSPLAAFRGQPMTHELAEEISFGHLGTKPWSWKVIAGQNPAYDFFPSQHMTYYKKAKQLWYQPVFQVITHDGQEVWRRRLYRVRRGKTPGTFYYTVLDNGVTSAEYWRILDVDEDMQWILFFYSGAAAAAGQSYSGAILASATGDWPADKAGYIDRVNAALDRAGIKPWELFMVRHGHNSDAPLEIDPLAEGRFQFPNSTAAAELPRTPAEGFIPKTPMPPPAAATVA